jgi:hypothetical protein
MPAEEVNKPAGVKKTSAALSGESSTVAERLREGALCEVVKIMDMPIELAPGYAVALIKALDPHDERTGLLLSSGVPAAKDEPRAHDAPAAPAPSAHIAEAKPVFTPLSSWEPLAPAEENGPAKNNWRDISGSRDEKLQHITTDLHYWYSEGYGSERRKKPA